MSKVIDITVMVTEPGQARLGVTLRSELTALGSDPEDQLASSQRAAAQLVLALFRKLSVGDAVLIREELDAPGRERTPGNPPNEHMTHAPVSEQAARCREVILAAADAGRPTVDLFMCQAEGLARQQARVVALLRAEAVKLTGKALYHPEHYLTRIAAEIEAGV